jgi:DNA polymerase-1
VGPDALIIAYHASAEWSCYAALGWPAPARILDLEAEFRCSQSGLRVEHGYSLVGALLHHGLEAIDVAEKQAMRELAQRGGHYSPEEKRALLDYCQSDVDALARLLPVMGPSLHMPQALHRGRYTAAVARMEYAGVPIDTELLARLLASWESIQLDLIRDVDASYGVYEGTSFRTDRFADYLTIHGIAWPRLPSGELSLDQDTFRDMSRIHPELNLLRDLRTSMGQMRLNRLAVGDDGRNRTMISQFASKTGRNQPSNTKFIFGPAIWLRGLIRPGPGRALAYVDWSQQEFGIAAYLSGDPAMIEAYETGDPYMAFAIQAGGAPPGATKETHEIVRELFKQCVLGLQYGLGVDGLAARIESPENRHHSQLLADRLVRDHKRLYAKFWSWSEEAVNHARIHGWLPTVFGWRVHVEGNDFNSRSMRNFPMQANGAEMLRMACILATEAGVEVLGPIHDALLTEAADSAIEAEVERTQGFMAKASRMILGGPGLRSDKKIIYATDRYMDKRGVEFWDKVMRLLPEAPG